MAIENFDMPDDYDPGAEFLVNLTRFIEEMERKKEVILGPIPNQLAFFSTLYSGRELVAWPRIKEDGMRLDDHDV